MLSALPLPRDHYEIVMISKIDFELLGDRKRITLISPHGLVGRGEYCEHGAIPGRAGKCEIHLTTRTPQARETPRSILLPIRKAVRRACDSR